jgi:hypothetical protein
MPKGVGKVNASVQYVLNRIINDEKFRSHFQDDPRVALKGVALSAKQRDALAKINVKDLLTTTHNLKDLTKAAIGSIYI